MLQLPFPPVLVQMNVRRQSVVAGASQDETHTIAIIPAHVIGVSTTAPAVVVNGLGLMPLANPEESYPSLLMHAGLSFGADSRRSDVPQPEIQL